MNMSNQCFGEFKCLQHKLKCCEHENCADLGIQLSPVSLFAAYCVRVMYKVVWGRKKQKKA